jgi:putative tricarboxylic transport membrane protein
MGLIEGIPFIPCLVGLFAISEVLNNLESMLKAVKIKARINRVLPSWEDIKTTWRPTWVSGLIGTVIGAIPGAGGDIAAFISYAEIKRESKHPETFGHGAPEGIAASESANNSCPGGAMIPMLTMGVPGDSNTAVLVGAFIMQGLTPGPMMYVDHLDIIYAVFAAMIVANIAMLLVGMAGVNFFSQVISLDRKYLMPIILALSLVGAYGVNQNMFDVGLAIVFGVIGYLLQKYDFPLAPILLALILGPMCETNLRRFMQIDDGRFYMIFTKPICVIFLLLAVGSISAGVMMQKKIEQREAEIAAHAEATGSVEGE